MTAPDFAEWEAALGDNDLADDLRALLPTDTTDTKQGA